MAVKTAMPMTTNATGYTSFEVVSYHYELFAKDENTASINLMDHDGETFAIAVFRPDTSTLPEQYQGNDGIYRIFYRRSAFPDVLDLLRNEKPVYLHYWMPDGHNTHIGTAIEPVGEGE
ncbi:MAG: hypothetical protein ACYTGP_10165 [Planctomycetota bacterium]|jgi:hypothetical protein